MEASKKSRRELDSIRMDRKDPVYVRDRKFMIGWIRPDVNWRINEIVEAEGEKNRLQAIHKVFTLGVLNSFIKIKLFYPLLWRWFYYVKGYSWDELLPAVTLIKKKIPLEAYWQGMALSVDMMTSWRTMEKKEAEQYRRELMSAAFQLSEKSTGGR